MGQIPQTVPSTTGGTYNPAFVASMCVHGYYQKGCPWCNPAAPGSADAEKDRRLKAFMPLIHSIVQGGCGTAEIEKILEIVENPRRKAADNAG